MSDQNPSPRGYVPMISPEAFGAAASHVEREYGYGYRMGVEDAAWHGAGVVFVQHSDGSTFRLYADRYGNVHRLPDRRLLADALQAFADEHERAEVTR